MSGKANKVLGVSQAIKQGYMESAKKDLDKGIVWNINEKKGIRLDPHSLQR